MCWISIELIYASLSASYCDSSQHFSEDTEAFLWRQPVLTLLVSSQCYHSYYYLCEWLLCGDWSVNREAWLWQSYLPALCYWA